MDFETLYKDRLPRHLVFPVSAAILQRELASAPQKERISVRYSGYMGMTKHRTEKTKLGRSGRIKHDQCREIVSASYKRSAVSLWTPNAWQEDKSFMNSYSQDQWKLTVRPVLLGDLPAVRAELEKDGYMRLLQWLVDTNKHAGTIGMYWFEIMFDGQSFTYRESGRK